MEVIKIGVVEDELIIADNIVRTLSEIGYQTTEVAISYSEAVVMVQEEMPDLIILDINLSGKKDGIDVAYYLNKKQKIPFIFLTANSDVATLERAKEVNPYAYLIKPFTKEELFISIELAVSNYNNFQNAAGKKVSDTNTKKEAIFLRSKQSFTKVLFSEILFVESAGNYITIYLANDEKLLHRSTLTEFAELLPHDSFYRTHRSFLVHTNAIQKIDEGELYIGKYQVPISKDHLKGLLDMLDIVE